MELLLYCTRVHLTRALRYDAGSWSAGKRQEQSSEWIWAFLNQGGDCSLAQLQSFFTHFSFHKAKALVETGESLQEKCQIGSFLLRHSHVLITYTLQLIWQRDRKCISFPDNVIEILQECAVKNELIQPNKIFMCFRNRFNEEPGKNHPFRRWWLWTLSPPSATKS